MRHVREGHRPRTAEQLSLFSLPTGRSVGQNPAWDALPPHARAELTALMVRLVLEHADRHGVTEIEAAFHEP